MKAFYVFLLLLIFCLGYTKAQERKWNKDTLLTWSDFKGSADPASGVSAMTYCGMKYKYRYIHSATDSSYTAKFNVYSYIDPDRSWSMKERQCPPLLNHEQIHFDISEYFARQLRCALESAHYTHNIKDEVVAIFNKYERERERVGLRYDKQTNHGTEVDIQQKWNLFVVNLLTHNPSWDEARGNEIMLEDRSN